MKLGLKLIIYYTLLSAMLSGVLFILLSIKSLKVVSLKEFLNSGELISVFIFPLFIVILMKFSQKFKPEDSKYLFLTLCKTVVIGSLMLSLFLFVNIEYRTLILSAMVSGLIVISYYNFRSRIKEFSLINMGMISLCLVDIILLQMIPLLVYNFALKEFYSSIGWNSLILFYTNALVSFVPALIYFNRERVVISIKKRMTICENKIRHSIIYICFGIVLLHIFLRLIHLKIVSSMNSLITS